MAYTATPLTAGTLCSFPVPTLSSTITVIAPSHHGNNTTESWSEFPQDHPPFGRGGPPRKRCRDYDGTEFLTLWSVSHVHDRLAIFMSVHPDLLVSTEKGFCMRGDMCPFDHGSDPVVVEDVNPSQHTSLSSHRLVPGVDGPPPPGLPPPHSLLTPQVNLRPPVPPPGTMPPAYHL